MKIVQSRKEIALKIVYCGPGLSGKTTNLSRLHALNPKTQRGALIKLDTETDRTLFFDCFPLSLGQVAGYKLKINFFTVPGQSFYYATRKAVLEGVDGVVFVADSDPRREDANIVSNDDLFRSLREMGRDLDALPVVYQWNKRDLPGALPIDLLQRTLNPGGRPAIEASAASGVGVWETQNLILKASVATIRSRPRRQRHRASV